MAIFQANLINQVHLNNPNVYNCSLHFIQYYFIYNWNLTAHNVAFSREWWAGFSDRVVPGAVDETRSPRVGCNALLCASSTLTSFNIVVTLNFAYWFICPIIFIGLLSVFSFIITHSSIFFSWQRICFEMALHSLRFHHTRQQSPRSFILQRSK